MLNIDINQKFYLFLLLHLSKIDLIELMSLLAMTSIYVF